MEDLLAKFITVSAVEMVGAQRNDLAAHREAQALVVFVDGLQEKLRDKAKAQAFETLKDALVLCDYRSFSSPQKHFQREKLLRKIS